MGIFVANCQCNNQLGDSFDDAANRFWHDAENLHTVGRLAAADHLYGLSAECALKAIITHECGGIRKQDKVHLPCIWDEFLLHPNNSLAQSTSANPFNGTWCIEHRYAADKHFDRPRLEKHRAGAKEANKLLEQSKINGQIP